MKPTFNKKKAFTLIELLIVIAIIGILFIVLVSKVDFATDKAKATGVQTDFRSFQVAFDTVAKENAGFNTFGWDTGDANQDGIRNSYDEGDNGAGGGIAQNGIQDGTEVFTGHKIYAETFTKVYSLKKNGTGSYDRDALNRLETAINANLDPKLHITIKDDGEIVMANGAQDPWNKEYHGWYITNAETDGQDRGAIVMYSDGANNEFGSEHTIANGIVKVIVPGNNKDGKDDYSIVSVYTYVNGHGEVLNMTTGFSNNQTLLGGNGLTDLEINNGGGEVVQPDTPEEPEISVPSATFNDGVTLSWDDLQLTENGTKYGYIASGISNTSIGSNAFQNCTSLTKIIIPNEVQSIGSMTFKNCTNLTNAILPKGITTITRDLFYGCSSLTNIVIPEGVTSLAKNSFRECSSLVKVTLPKTLQTLGDYAFTDCTSIQEVYYNGELEDYLKVQVPGPNISHPMYYGSKLYINNVLVTSLVIPETCTSIGAYLFQNCKDLTSLVLHDNVTTIGPAFQGCTNLVYVDLGNSVQTIENYAFMDCVNLSNIVLPNSVKTIGQSAFFNCKLKEVTLPANIVNIGQSAFNTCEHIYVLSTTPCQISGYPFGLSGTMLTIHVPQESLELYQSAWQGLLHRYGTDQIIVAMEQN